MFHFGSLAPPRGSLGYPGPGAGGTKGNPSTLPVPFRSLWKGFSTFIYEIFAQDASRRTSGNEGNFPRFPRFPEVVGVNVAMGGMEPRVWDISIQNPPWDRSIHLSFEPVFPSGQSQHHPDYCWVRPVSNRGVDSPVWQSRRHIGRSRRAHSSVDPRNETHAANHDDPKWPTCAT